MKIKYTEYSSVEAMQEVIGSLLIDHSLLKKYKVSYTDFTKPFYMYVFLAIEHLLSQGANDITPILIKEYLQNNTEKYASFKAQGGIETLQMLIETSNTSNFEYHYELLKKFSLLRDLKTAGIDVSDFFDPEEVDVAISTKKREKLEKTSLDDIYSHYRSLLSDIASKHMIDLGYTESESINDFNEYLSFIQDNAYGLPFSSAYINTITKGQQKGKLYVISASSGVGKTRNLIGNICHTFSPEYFKNDKWIKNVSGQENRALYIGSEMDINKEIIPIMLAYISDVDEQCIHTNNLDESQLKRVEKAMEIYNRMCENGNIKLIDFPEYTISSLKSKISEEVKKNNITHVYLDYIHTTASLLAEFSQNSGKGYSLREDQALTEITKMLKALAKKLNICIVTCTQITGDADNSDKSANLIRGAKSIIDKADVGIIYSHPNKNEKKEYDKIFKEKLFKREPNLVMSVYKNRGGLNNVKVFLEINYGTMRVHDIVVMDFNNEKLPLNKTYLRLENKKIIASVEKYSL